MRRNNVNIIEEPNRTDYNSFAYIVKFILTSIESITLDKIKHNLKGMRLTAPYKGINVIDEKKRMVQ